MKIVLRTEYSEETLVVVYGYESMSELFAYQ